MFMNLKILLILIAGPLFLIGVIGHIVVRLKLRPGNREMEESYYEFEDRHPAFRRYEFWSRLMIALIAASMLMLFLVIAL